MNKKLKHYLNKSLHQMSAILITKHILKNQKSQKKKPRKLEDGFSSHLLRMMPPSDCISDTTTASI